MITAQNLVYRPFRSPRDLINIKHLTFAEGHFHALIGANGAGKSTLLRTLSGDLFELTANVQLNGQKICDISIAQLAQQRAVLPQSADVAFAISVREVVAFGRNVYHQQSAATFDLAVIDQVMGWLSIDHLANTNYQSLSGGEQHRTQIARTLAQLLTKPEANLSGKIWFLDEPTNHLDIKHQYTLMTLLSTLKARGLTIVCVLHDLALALNYADSLFLLRDGKSAGHFSPQNLVSSGTLDQAYDLTMNAHYSEHYQRFVVMPEL